MKDPFTENRGLLFGIAYRMLGSVAEAEDMVQETFVRWQRQDAGTIETPKAWLVAALTRLCIDELRSARRRREDYVGVWLPEPLVDATVPAPDASAALADSLGIAFLMMLEELSPSERAVFLLREAFDHDYGDIARIVGKTEAACRKMFSRAKAQLARRGPPPERSTGGVEPIVQRFLGACAGGDLRELLAVLTDNVVLYTDGGGRVKAARRPIETADHVARFFIGIRERAFVGATTHLIRVNGGVGVLIHRPDGLVNVTTFAFERDRIRAIYSVSNPDKLRHVPGAGADGRN
ncbi:MAG TPA: RNA polymerase sigma-70 factor [Opitutus sp.]|nr:RNA polymerase sigma-70 factor [Opitutus sp.]